MKYGLVLDKNKHNFNMLMQRNQILLSLIKNKYLSNKSNYCGWRGDYAHQIGLSPPNVLTLLHPCNAFTRLERGGIFYCES